MAQSCFCEQAEQGRGYQGHTDIRSQFLQMGDFSHEYDDPLWETFGCIYRPITDIATSSLVTETRPCHYGISCVHKLTCGHYVWTDVRSQCGKTCENSCAPEYDGFRCTLCIRKHAVANRVARNKRWQDLLLPPCVDIDRETKVFKEHGRLFRATEPVYLEPRSQSTSIRTASSSFLECTGQSP
jgi:hypothetical protein